MNFKQLILGAVSCALLAAALPAGAAAEFGTAAEAEAMVKRAIEHMKAGKEQAYADFTAKKAPFADRDLYVTVTSLSGPSMAHGQNAKMVGMDMSDFRDVDGKAYFRERFELAKTKGKFWQDFKFVDPVTKKVLPKSMYCERESDVIVCTGIYKR
ncbi:cache domain-containing protein [Ramlibacter sp.]|uniref:cache domain-containing protein n=1 Tax=Ramlibacter sp. TaxID=1917967 RepID=UPI002C41594D|nr:cache domain-containing protein [Ramlibacter sp.]HWI80411.1 cache domain-containing protein [Ramlibacter sp.]